MTIVRLVMTWMCANMLRVKDLEVDGATNSHDAVYVSNFLMYIHETIFNKKIISYIRLL